MKKSKLGKILLFVAVLCLTVSLLVSCNMLNSGSTDNTKKEQQTSGGETTEEKISLADATKNYDDAEQKRADVKADASIELYYVQGGEGKTGKMGVEVDLTRMEKDGKIYDEIRLAPGQVTPAVIGMLTTVVNFCEGKTETLPLEARAAYAVLKADLKEKMKDLAPYLLYVQSFLNGEITCKAEAGYESEDINLKAEYRNSKKNGGGEGGSLWCAASADSVSYFLPGELTDAKIRSFLTDPLLKLIAFSGGTDEASDRVTKTGEAKYTIKPRINTEKDAIKQLLGDLFDLLNVNVSESLVNELFVKIGNWVTVENESTFNVTVDKDKMPSKTDYKLKVTADIPVDEFKKTVIGLKEYGLPDDVATMINTIVSAMNKYVGFCGAHPDTDPDYKDKIGFSFVMNVDETYKYAAKDCDVSAKDEDLFKAADTDEEGRLELDAFVKKLSVDEVSAFVEKAVELIGSENGEEISVAIRERAAEKEDVAPYDLAVIIVDVLKEYAKTDETLEGAVGRIVEKILSGELKVEASAESETKE